MPKRQPLSAEDYSILSSVLSQKLASDIPDKYRKRLMTLQDRIQDFQKDLEAEQQSKIDRQANYAKYRAECIESSARREAEAKAFFFDRLPLDQPGVWNIFIKDFDGENEREVFHSTFIGIWGDAAERAWAANRSPFNTPRVEKVG